MHKNFLCLKDCSADELNYLLRRGIKLKSRFKAGEVYRPFEGKVLAMLFEKASTRTRVSFETGMYQLGGHPLFLSADDLQIGRGEPVQDTARVLSRYLDGIMIRTFEPGRIRLDSDYQRIDRLLPSVPDPCRPDDHPGVQEQL